MATSSPIPHKYRLAPRPAGNNLPTERKNKTVVVVVIAVTAADDIDVTGMFNIQIVIAQWKIAKTTGNGPHLSQAGIDSHTKCNLLPQLRTGARWQLQPR